MPFDRPRSGRPEPDEHAPYMVDDIARVEGEDVVEALERQGDRVVALLSPLDPEAASFRYAPEKWSIREVIGHLADDERIYAYRALAVARGETSPLPGFDENLYVRNGAFDERSVASLLTEYEAVRRATIALFEPFTPSMWIRRGEANGFSVTPRGLGFHIAAHELHHLRILAERYLLRG